MNDEADVIRVMEDQLNLLHSVTGWQFVLAHYARTDIPTLQPPQIAEQTAGKQKNWLNRYEILSPAVSAEMEEKYSELTDDQVSQAHGMLIALGLIEFDLISRSDGIGYSLTSAGKKLLANPELIHEQQESDTEPLIDTDPLSDAA